MFENGLKHGIGCYRDVSKGVFFHGEYFKGKKENYGVECVEGNYEYKGNFKAGMKSGKGFIKCFAEKYSYEGEFLNDKKHGEGILVD